MQDEHDETQWFLVMGVADYAMSVVRDEMK